MKIDAQSVGVLRSANMNYQSYLRIFKHLTVKLNDSIEHAKAEYIEPDKIEVLYLNRKLTLNLAVHLDGGNNLQASIWFYEISPYASRPIVLDKILFDLQGKCSLEDETPGSKSESLIEYAPIIVTTLFKTMLNDHYTLDLMWGHLDKLSIDARNDRY